MKTTGCFTKNSALSGNQTIGTSYSETTNLLDLKRWQQGVLMSIVSEYEVPKVWVSRECRVFCETPCSILFIIDRLLDLIKSLFLYFSGADKQLTRSWNIVCSPVLLNICADWSLHLEHRNRRTMNHHEAQKTDGPFWGGGGARHGVTQLSSWQAVNIKNVKYPFFCWKPQKKNYFKHEKLA